jgi:cobalt-zinc-cadmium efflux system outer membrane protein
VEPSAYRDSANGFSADDLVRRAIDSNGELAAARLEVQRARGRLRQAGLSPNPILSVDYTFGRWTGSQGEKDFMAGVTLPVELGGKKAKRIDLGAAELAATEAEVSDRERRLAAEVRNSFAVALAALRELEITSELNAIDRQTVQFVEARVKEGETAPLELSLLRADSERLRSRRALIQGRLEAAVLRLKSLASFPVAGMLRLREDIVSVTLTSPPAYDDGLRNALATRPDLRLARLNEQVAEAGLRLARAQATPDMAVSLRFGADGEAFDSTPIGLLTDSDRLISFGVAVALPFRNRNQGERLEAQAAILQARSRREYVESLVRAEVRSGYLRYEAAQAAVAIYEAGVISRSVENLKAVRGAYEIGAFRITDLLVEQRRSVDFQMEYTEALAERYRARADLDTALGATIQ